jgi:hypothetical protein
MPTSSYQVVTSTVTMPTAPTGTTPVNEFRISVPTGTKPLGGGYFDADSDLAAIGPVYLMASYPDAQQWVFRIVGSGAAPRTVTLYVTAASV